MPNNVDSVIANEALQQTSAPPCSPRLFTYFSAPLQLAVKRLVIKTYFLVTRVSDYNVYESRDSSRQLLKCHTVTKLLFNLLAAAATKKEDEKCPSYNICPIGRNKEREEKFPQPHLPCYSAPTHEDRWCFHYAKDP